MPRRPQDVTDTELAILQVLWEQGEASRRQITDALYPEGGPAQYATIQKLLERLEAKGYVRHSRTGGMLTFRAAIRRERLIQRRLLDVAEKLCGGSTTPLLMNLLQARPLDAAELRALEELVKELSRKHKRPGAEP
ncbi:MAG TPA: BlaI/MecI/CopY family transcriptional regulator [Gemmataceae bacterium]|nr:BlaI/MecI/CopY family transcriptional regulator [Gemmataceae bacterium]